MRLSAALIVKNGERTLAECLASFRHVVDDLVIVDTGSTDNTTSIAAEYGARLFEFPWTDDFSAARQFAFDRATGEWVMWVDADDVVLHAERIRPLIETVAADVGMLFWPYVYARDAFGNSLAEMWRERCVRNDGSFHWAGRVHEVLASDGHWERLYSDLVAVEHHKQPDTERGENAGHRNRDILEAQSRDADGGRDPRILFYLARERADTGDTRGAIRAYRDFLRVGSWEAERYMAQTGLAALYRRLRRYKTAIRADMDALATRPEWPHAYFGLAETYYYLQEWEKVVHWADLGRCMPAPSRLPISFPMTYRFDWIIYYTNALYRLGDLAGAEEWTRRALEIRPDDRWHRANIGLFGSFHPPRTWADDEICYYASHGGPHFFPWSPAALEGGLGGAETAVIELSRAWQQSGYRVTVFGDPRERAGIYDGVVYRPWYDMRWQDHFNILILWRYPHLLDRTVTARRVFMDVHDSYGADDWSPQRLTRADRLFLKSQAHRALLPNVPDGKVAIVGNGW